MTMRLAIIGTGYGSTVLLPAFRATGCVDIVAVAGRDGNRAAAVATENSVPASFDDVGRLLALEELDAVAVAVPPREQEAIVNAAIDRGLHVFAEKPLALTLEGARRMSTAAVTAGIAHVVDFNFREIAAFRVARELLRAGTVGALRHVSVSWQVESYANRMRLRNWKAEARSGGGSLSNFVSHSFDYLEYLVGPIEGLSARLAGMPGDDRPGDAFVALALEFAGGVAGSLTMSAAAYRGSGHRIEIYGEDGTLILENAGPDYMRGFRVLHAIRPNELMEIEIAQRESDHWTDGRILPVSRLTHRFLDWIQNGIKAESDFEAGARVQQLLDAANMAHRHGRWVACSRAEPDLSGSTSSTPSRT